MGRMLVFLLLAILPVAYAIPHEGFKRDYAEHVYGAYDVMEDAEDVLQGIEKYIEEVESSQYLTEEDRDQLEGSADSLGQRVKNDIVGPLRPYYPFNENQDWVNANKGLIERLQYAVKDAARDLKYRLKFDLSNARMNYRRLNVPVTPKPYRRYRDWQGSSNLFSGSNGKPRSAWVQKVMQQLLGGRWKRNVRDTFDDIEDIQDDDVDFDFEDGEDED